MPTGYTAGVADGTVTDFRTFALQCARQFGACIMQRDDPASDPPKERQVEPFYRQRLNDARERYAWLHSLTTEEAADQAAIANEKAVRQWQETVQRVATEQERYAAMLREAEAWEPPTPDHVGLKKFMIQQLKDSMDFDNYQPEPPKQWTALGWLTSERERTAKDIASAETALREEEQRCAGASAWVRALYASLDCAEAPHD